METPASVARRFPWSFRQANRPFPGKIKVLEAFLIHAASKLEALARLIRDLQEGEPSGVQQLAAVTEAARVAILRLDAQCLNCLAIGLRPSQRKIVASILRSLGAYRQAVNNANDLGRSLMLIHGLPSQAARLQLQKLGSETLNMFFHALEAFRTMDRSMARAVLEQETWTLHLARSFQSRSAQMIFQDERNLDWIAECHSVVHYWEGIVSSATVLAQEVLMLQAPILSIPEPLLVQ